MRCPVLTAIAAALLTVCVSPPGSYAQGRRPYPRRGFVRPPYSPYLNLVRPGTPPGINYYGLVRPQQAYRQSIQDLQQDVRALDLRAGAVERDLQSGLPTTGHPTQFLNHTRYFFNNGAVGATTSRQVAGPPRTSVTTRQTRAPVAPRR